MARHLVGATARQLTQPRKEAHRVAQLPQIAPRGEEHILGNIAAQIEVAYNRECDRTDERSRRVDQVCEGFPIARRRRTHVPVESHLTHLRPPGGHG